MAIYHTITVPSTGLPGVPGSINSTSVSKNAPRHQLDLSRCTLEQFTSIPKQELDVPSSRSVSTPPDSPTRLRPARMDPQDRKMHDSGAMTPPATPTSHSHFVTDSASEEPETRTSLARPVSMASTTSVPRSPSIHSHPVPLQIFDHEMLEYVILVDDKGNKRPIGSGVWSDVYLATSGLATPADQPFLLPPSATKLSPITTVRSHDSAIGMYPFPAVPPLYAIKAPASTSSRKVLKEEAKILSYLSQFPDSDDHIVQFFGLDTRNNALVLKAMDSTLEDWIKNNLNNLNEDVRATELAAVFPRLALALIDSLIWMQDKNCVHADIKPANILATATPSDRPSVPGTVFSDFSSTILTAPNIEVHNASPLGAGTWDYLDPSLLSSSAPAEPSAATDLWSLAITLLFLVIGASPFDAFRRNKYQQREMIKSGCPLQCLAYDDSGIRNVHRMMDLSRALGLDLDKWFSRVLVKDVGRRVDVGEWRDELVGATMRMGAMV